MPKPDEAGSMLADIIDRLPDLIESGAYADIRKPPIAELCKSVARTEE
jgi:hypothetical protein